MLQRYLSSCYHLENQSRDRCARYPLEDSLTPFESGMTVVAVQMLPWQALYKCFIELL